MLLLAVLPWWLGLPLLLALAAALLAEVSWLADHAVLLRRGLRWGLPGWLARVLLSLGGDARAWVLTLLAGLAGFSLLMLLEGWLGRDRARPSLPSSTAEWPDLAMAPIGPPAMIIELEPPSWQDPRTGVPDPRGGSLQYSGHALTLADGTRMDGVEPRCSFSVDGRWLAVSLPNEQGVAMQDRQRRRWHRLRGWQLSGWHDGQPWLVRDESSTPRPLPYVLGQDDA
ncbi:hypothetical protein [Dyella sp. A6]|uniref:hypothetical protein n=1 Tax=Dyella aluminiiresistens TaxID=3069105 RepID=UPI002E75B9A2|nr:hypothetical protein [Dyella sp. A6]